MFRYSVGTIWRRCVKRVIRRGALYVANPSFDNERLLREAVRLANRLAL